MTTPSDRHCAALERNLAELQKAILIRTTMLGYEDARYFGHMFLRVSYDALFNAYMAHCLRVFERGSTASFWYLQRSWPDLIGKYLSENGHAISELENVSDKLKHIRDKTQFHIDANAVLDPAAVWRHAAIRGSDLSRAVDAAWGALSALAPYLGYGATTLPDYTRKDSHAAVALVESGPPHGAL